MVQNELVFMELDPMSDTVNQLKLANTILTALSLAWIYRSHHLKVGLFAFGGLGGLGFGMIAQDDMPGRGVGTVCSEPPRPIIFMNGSMHV